MSRRKKPRVLELGPDDREEGIRALAKVLNMPIDKVKKLIAGTSDEAQSPSNSTQDLQCRTRDASNKAAP